MSDDGEYILLSSCVIYVATEGVGENSLKLELERVNSTADIYDDSGSARYAPLLRYFKLRIIPPQSSCFTQCLFHNDPVAGMTRPFFLCSVEPGILAKNTISEAEHV
ncbi:protein of unknown function [Enterobacter cancerogenus]|uniref:hypothetical protein n=1 Tax=Enterobacter cancerogenus TaxID=69218 RepID=UPI00192707C1|nr:hypothetical protein [Enterobacter cancerogenus]CAD5355194.1 protein of unknown function [Enterobacter cancerogenus]